ARLLLLPLAQLFALQWPRAHRKIDAAALHEVEDRLHREGDGEVLADELHVGADEEVVGPDAAAPVPLQDLSGVAHVRVFEGRARSDGDRVDADEGVAAVEGWGVAE